MSLLLALAALAAPPYPDTAAAQARFRAAIEASPQTGAEISITSDDPCRTLVSTLWWSRAPAKIAPIDWRQAFYARFQDNDPDNPSASASWLEVAHPAGFRELHPFRAQSAAMLAAANDLIRLCAPDGAKPALIPPLPLPPSAHITARRQMTPLVPGDTKTTRCLFAAAPELVLEYRKKPGAIRLARYEARSRMLAFDINGFWLSLGQYPPGTPGAWRGLAAMPSFEIGNPTHRLHKIIAAKLSLDGKPLDFPLLIQHPEDALGRGPLGNHVSVMLADSSDTPAFLDTLTTGGIVEIRLYGETGDWIDRWDYDMATLRDVPAALAAANWTCNGATPIPAARAFRRRSGNPRR